MSQFIPTDLTEMHSPWWLLIEHRF